MTTLNVGDVLPFAIEIRDATGALVNATTVTLTIVEPDGTERSPITVSPTSTGVYSHLSVTADAHGRWVGHWVATGTNAGAEYQAFTVEGAPPVVTLAEAKSHAGIIGTSDDARAQVFLDAAVDIVEDEAGAIVPRTVTNELHTPSGGTLFLHVRPVTTVSTVEQSFGGAWTALSDVDLDDPTFGQVSTNAAPGARVRVTYTAGRALPSAKVRFAVLDAFKYLWTQATGPSGDAFGGPAAAAGVSAAYRQRLRLILGNEALNVGGFG